jgi:Tfp pilus assembly protein PilO
VLLAKVDKLTKKLEDYEKVISKSKDESWLITEVSSLANKAKVRVLSVEPLKKSVIKAYDNISIQVDLLCSYHDLGKFVSLLESSKELLRIAKLEITTREEKKTVARVVGDKRVEKVTLIVSTYNKR